jgi:hypothetical protein
MERLVKSYLDNNYYVDTSQVGNDGIYRLNDNAIHKCPLYGDKLLSELVTIFLLPEKELKKYVDEWAKNKKKDCNFAFYWKTLREIAGLK